MPDRFCYDGRLRRPARSAAVAAVVRPTLVIAAASAVTLGTVAPAAAHPGEHTVQPGDTLSSLAAGHGTTWQTVYTDNRGTIGADPNALRTGQLLTIGGSGSTPPSPSGPPAYVVRAGDTLDAIAARHGITWQQLHALNREVIGEDPDVLRLGQRLVLDGATAPSGSAAAPGAPGAVPPRASRGSDRSAGGEAAAPASAASDRPTPTSSPYSAWDPHVRPVVDEVAERFGVPTVVTRPGHSPTQGRAADFMVYTDQAMGDAVARYVIDNAARLGVEYVIWRQRIHLISSGSWQAMADRGSATANHMDHPHVAFLPAG